MKTINKNKLTATVLAILLTISSLMLLTTAIVNAQTGLHTVDEDTGSVPLPAGVTPDITVKTDIYLSFRPNPVGLNQIFLINLWNDPGPSYARFFRDYKVSIMKPDGTTDVILIDSYTADGTAWFEYIATQVGEWQIKFDFQGGYFPPGKYRVASGSRAGYIEEYTKSVYYLPDSTEWQTLTVQEDIVYSWPEAGLPTDYWTRPVSSENRHWFPILGNYPWHGPSDGGANWPAETSTNWNARHMFTPYVQAPNTAHIVWQKMEAISGIMGGDYGAQSQTSGGNTPSIIYAGYCYDSKTRVIDGETQSAWVCTDLRTGEVLWERTGVTAPTVIEYSEGSESIPGAEASVGVSVSLVGISGNTLRKFNPATGAMTLERTIPSFRSSEYYRNGYVLSTQVISDADQSFRLINWTTLGTSSNFASRVVSNISFPLDTLGQSRDYDAMSCFVIREVNAWDPNGLKPWSPFPYVDLTVDGGTGIRHGYRMIGIDLLTGEWLFDNTYNDEPYSADQMPYSQQTHVAESGKLAILMRKGFFNVYDSRTGEFLFRTEDTDYPWDEPGFGAYTIASAYGMFYRGAYSGVYAFSWEDGSIVWKYEAKALSVYETPYTNPEGETVYSWNGGVQVADGKVFWQNSEHTPTQPITRGWGLHAIDAYTGKGVWNITSCMAPGAVADGYLTASSTYDGHTYVFGKGKSATTVTAPDVAVPKGTAMTIKGTVLDLSPAQAGTPCVSANSMATQMEYIHFQQPIGGLWGDEILTGVLVTLTAISPDGSCVDIGTTTTSAYYGTFGLAWTPQKEGTYEIVASFAGDDSYGSSGASTFVTVGPAVSASAPVEPETPETPDNPTTPDQPTTPEEPTTPEQPTTPEEPEAEPETELISTELAIALAVVAACIIGAVAYIALQKRK